MRLRRWFLEYSECIAPYLSEFLGTFFVAFALGCCKISGNEFWMPTSGAFTIMVVMYVTFAVSGGLVNPALSIAFGFAGKLNWFRVCFYCVVQVVAGILGSLLATGMLDKRMQVGPKNGFDWVDVAIVDLIYSTMFCFVGLNCMTSMRCNPPKDQNQFFALAVGFVTIAGGHASMDVSGSLVMNPAVTLGFGFTSGDVDSCLWAIVYACYQIAGAAIAAMLFFLIRPEELAALGITGKGLSCGRACSALHICGGGRIAENSKADPGVRRQSQNEEEPLNVSPISNRPGMTSKLLSELLGTYVIMFTFSLGRVLSEFKPQRVVMMMVSADKPTKPGEDFGEELKSSTVAWETGAAVLCMVYSLGNVSGGHFNPAITLGAMVCRKCTVIDGIFFILAQVSGCILGALTYTCVDLGGGLGAAVHPKLGPKHDFTMYSVAIGETALTVAVVLVYLCMVTVKSLRYYSSCSTSSFQFALAIGMSVSAGGMALGSITGGLVNPALAFGVSISNFFVPTVGFHFRIKWFLGYIISELCGGCIAGLIFMLTHPADYKRDPLMDDEDSSSCEDVKLVP